MAFVFSKEKMSLDELIRHILLLSPEEKDRLLGILEMDRGARQEGFLHLPLISKLPEWNEIDKRAREIVHEQKTCLIHFDDHIQSITL